MFMSVSFGTLSVFLHDARQMFVSKHGQARPENQIWFPEDQTGAPR
jgi:hypothetical protein